MKILLSVALLLTSIFVYSGCSSDPKYDTNVPEGMYNLGTKYEKDERYEEALAILGQLKNKHPYSKFATEAELKMADIQYKREEYIEAQGSYQTFKEMHPSHARIDYVTFRLAMSFFQQLPSSIDRDLSVGDRAILYFDEVIQSYPKSEHVGAAKENKSKTMRMLADKELYIANFYFIRKRWESALSRYEDTLKKYPALGVDPQALYGAAISAYRIKELPKAKAYYHQLMSEHKDSPEADKARSELGSSI